MDALDKQTNVFVMEMNSQKKEQFLVVPLSEQDDDTTSRSHEMPSSTDEENSKVSLGEAGCEQREDTTSRSHEMPSSTEEQNSKVSLGEGCEQREDTTSRSHERPSSRPTKTEERNSKVSLGEGEGNYDTTSRSHEVSSSTEIGDINIVLLGQTGTGKSVSGNTILGKPDFFSSGISAVPLTRECQKGDVDLLKLELELKFKSITVINTPDFFYEDVDMQTPEKHVKKCRDLCQSRTCVYLLVMQLGRFTDCERNILEKLEKAFGEKIREKTIILFTHGDRLKRSDPDALSKFVNGNDRLKAVVKQCGDRYHVFDNHSSSENNQVTDLMQMVYDLICVHSQSTHPSLITHLHACWKHARTTVGF